jgi:hypothetical protein
LLLLSVLLAFFGLAGCASVPAVSNSEAVSKRAAARWELLMAGNLDQAYRYLSPGKRALTTLDQYRAAIRLGLWRSAKVDKVECSAADVCRVTVLVSYIYQGKSTQALDVTRPLFEVWRRDADEWWFVEVE